MIFPYIAGICARLISQGSFAWGPRIQAGHGLRVTGDLDWRSAWISCGSKNWKQNMYKLHKPAYVYIFIYIYKYVWKTEVLYEIYVFLYDWSMICLFVTHGSELECTKVCRLNAVWLSYQQGYRISLRVYQIFSRDTHLKCQPRMNKPWLVNIFLWTGGHPSDQPDQAWFRLLSMFGMELRRQLLGKNVKF